VKPNGRLFNGHGGKSKAGKLIEAKTGIASRPGRQPREDRASA
jgi:hypothetical protein